MSGKVERQEDAICFLNSLRAWGGGEKWLLDMARHLGRDGRVCVAASPSSELGRRAESAGLPVYFEASIGNLTLLNLWRMFRLFLFFRRKRIKCLVVNLPSDLKAAGIAAYLAGVPRIIYQRGIAKPVRDNILNRLLFRRIVTHVVATSIETKRTILSNNAFLVSDEKIHVVYNGIDLESFDASQSIHAYPRKPGEIVLGHAGRLSYEKNQKFLMDVVKELKDQGVACTLLIAGTGPLEKELKDYAFSRSLEHEVIFLGFQENIASFMADIDIFLLSSHWEGFGYVLIEAMAARKPVVAFNHSSSPEIVADNTTGFLVPFGDREAYASRVKELANDCVLREKMGSAGRIRVEELFTFTRAAENFRRIAMPR